MQSGDWSAASKMHENRLEGAGSNAQSPDAAAREKRKAFVLSLVSASLSLTDSVVMAVNAHHGEQQLASAVSTSSSSSGSEDAASSPKRSVVRSRPRTALNRSPGFDDIPPERTVVSSPTLAAPRPAKGNVSSRAQLSPSISKAVSADPLTFSSPTERQMPAISFPGKHSSYGITGTMIKLPPPPVKKGTIVYKGCGHWSNTVRYNSMVVLQQLDKALKERLAHLEEVLILEGMSVVDFTERMAARRQKHHETIERYVAKGMDPVNAILRAQHKRERKARKLRRTRSQPNSAFNDDVEPLSPVVDRVCRV